MKNQKQNNEKVKLVSQIKDLDPSSKVTADNSRDFLRGELAKLKKAGQPQDELPRGFASKKAAEDFYAEKINIDFDIKNVGNSVTKMSAGEDKPTLWFNTKTRVANWTGVPLPTPAPVVAPPAPKPATLEQKVAATASLCVPPPPVPLFTVPLPPVPPTIPAPPQIDLVKEDDKKNKRYVSKTDASSKYHLRDRSDAEKPVSIVRRICAANPGLERKEVIQLCLLAGVNKNTAATQYSLWRSASRKAAVTVAPDSDVTGDDENEE